MRHTKIDGVEAAIPTVTRDRGAARIFGIGTLPSLEGGFADICKLPALCAPSYLADSPCAAINGAYGVGNMFRNGLLENWIICGLVLYAFGNHHSSHYRLLPRWCWACISAIDRTVLGIGSQVKRGAR